MIIEWHNMKQPGNKLDVKAMGVLGDAIGKNKKLSYLSLIQNGIDSAGVNAFACGLKINTALETLWLDCEQISIHETKIQ